MPPQTILLAMFVFILCVSGAVCLFLILAKIFGKGKHNQIACDEINSLIEMQQEVNYHIKQKFKTLSREDKQLTVGKWGKNVMQRIS